MAITKVEIDGYTIKPSLTCRPSGESNIVISKNGKYDKHTYIQTGDQQSLTPEEMGRLILEDYQNAAYLGSLTYKQYIDWLGYEDQDSKEAHKEYKDALTGLKRLDEKNYKRALARAKTRIG